MDKWIIRLIILIVNVASPELRVILGQWIGQLEIEAKKTKNPWDDILVGLLKSILLGK